MQHAIKVYPVKSAGHEVESLLSAPQAGEGVFGFEMMMHADQEETFLFAPSIFKRNHNQTIHKEWGYLQKLHKRWSSYSMTFQKPMFMPIRNHVPFSFWEKLKEVRGILIEERVLVQVLIQKRKDAWQETCRDQYHMYLEGNDYPGSTKLWRLLQKKGTRILDALTKFYTERESVEDLEEKTREAQGFQLQVRVFIQSNTRERESVVVETINSILSEWDYYNEMRLTSTRTKHALPLLIQRSFSGEARHHVMSQSEVLSFISDTYTVSKRRTNVPTERTNRSDPRFELLPIGAKKKSSLDHKKAQEVIEGLRKTGVVKDQHIHVTSNHHGPTMQAITLEVPEGVKLSSIQQVAEDIKVYLDADDLTIERGSEPGTVCFIVPRDDREVLHVKELLDCPAFLSFAEKAILPYALGVDEKGERLYRDLARDPHLLVSGETGGGKSQFLNQLLLTILIMIDPNKVKMFMIDPKRVELSPFRGFPAVEEVITDMEESAEFLAGLVEEMEDRYDVFEQHGYRSLEGFNENMPDDARPYILCVIDEFSDLVMTHEQVQDYIVRIGQKGRASGIHLIVATQRPDGRVINANIKAQLTSKIAFRCGSPFDYKTIFGEYPAYKDLLGKGDGCAKLSGHKKTWQRFQSPVVTIDEKEMDNILERYKEENDGEVKECTVKKIPKQDDKARLKSIINETGETRIRQLREKMNIKNNKLVKLMEDLECEAFLLKEGRGYVVNKKQD